MEKSDLSSAPKIDKSGVEDVDLGTFKSVKTLKEAYDSLRKTFTQNAMELAKYKKEAELLANFDSKSEEDLAKNIDKINVNSETKNAKIDDKKIVENSVKKEERHTAEENPQNAQNSSIPANFSDYTTQNEQLSAENSTKEKSENDAKISADLETNQQKNSLESLLKSDESDKVKSPDETTSADKVSTPAQIDFESVEWQQNVQEFFAENQDAKEFAREIGKEMMQDKDTQESKYPLQKAWIRVLQKRNASPQIDEATLTDFALKNEVVRQKIITDYLSAIQHKKSSPKLISEAIGAEFNAKKTSRALNMNEAKELARKILL